MDNISKGNKLALFILSVTYICMVAVIIQALRQRGIHGLEPIYVLDIGIDLVGIVLGYVLFICCVFDIQKTGAKLRYFIYMLNVNMWSLFTDAGSWLLDGLAEYRWLNILDNTLLFMCAPLSAFCFWKYVSGIISINKTYERILDRIIAWGLLAAIAMRIINLFTGIYFTVDADGIYIRSSLYILSMLYSVAILLIVGAIVLIERKQLQTYRVVALILYILAPFIAVLITTATYGLSLSGVVIMLVLLLMYCILNITQGREKAAADYELSVASSIQENILPRIFPFMPEKSEFDIYATMTPAKEVGGDFYDFFMVDDDHLAVVIADVSGKGMPAALFMMVSRTLLKNRTQANNYELNPGEILSDVNNQLCEGNSMEYFVTAWIGIVELSTGHICYASAGHEYPAVYKKGGKFEIIKGKNSPPLAAMEGLKYKTDEADFNPGDTLVIYTDGVAEATNSENELFGLDRMLDALNENPDASVKEIDDTLRKRIDIFVQDAPQFDDITILTLRYNGNSGM